ncbi:MAG: carboxypeptidase-like regulatory domain-containing protein [Candidatus Acidiferrales bacterium]
MIPKLVLVLALGVLPVSGHQAPAAEQQQEKQKEQKPDEFVLAGTVFTEQGFALPGAAVRVRRAGEKKVREKAQSDRRGEFALRLRPGFEYEATVEVKGYEPQTKKFAAEVGAVNTFIFRMQPERSK